METHTIVRNAYPVLDKDTTRDRCVALVLLIKVDKQDSLIYKYATISVRNGRVDCV